MSAISTKTTAHIASLANLPLSEKEIQTLTPQLDSVVSYTTKTSQLNTDAVEETAQVTGLENIFREDEVDTSRMFSQEEALANARQTHKGFFVVPAVLEER